MNKKICQKMRREMFWNIFHMSATILLGGHRGSRGSCVNKPLLEEKAPPHHNLFQIYWFSPNYLLILLKHARWRQINESCFIYLFYWLVYFLNIDLFNTLMWQVKHKWKNVISYLAIGACKDRLCLKNKKHTLVKHF